MKHIRILLIALLAQLLWTPLASAGDFDWLSNLNIEAKANLSNFRVRLASRFHIGNAEISTVIHSTDRPSDAYMVLRLSEMTRRPPNEVLRVYRQHKRRGWGYMAKRLGIKPGSREFHELKERHDLYSRDDEENGSSHRHDHRHGNGIGREKHHGHGHGR